MRIVVGGLGGRLSESSEKLKRRPINLDTVQVPEGRVHVIAERCKECDFCITYCPTDVLVYSNDANAKGYRYPEVAKGKEHSCVLCRFCDLICPEVAIFTTDSEQQEVQPAIQQGAQTDEG